MNIYKLQYTDKTEGDADLLSKGTYEVIEGEQVYRNGTQAIVYLGKIVKTPAIIDSEGDESVAAVYYDGVFYDIMTTEEYDFGDNEVSPTNTTFAHTFLGCKNNNIETEVEPE
tara:strand:+ start:17 stop:355 length:339 start_codon:yes stop_codon:yes gene_type:complete